MKHRCLALLALLLPACQTPRPVPPVRWPGDQPRADLIHDDVTWLAADARGGRRAGTRGADQSAEYIARRLTSLGLEPAGEEGTWFQVFEVPLPARDGGASFLEWSEAVIGSAWTAAGAVPDDAPDDAPDAARGRALVGPLGGPENIVPLFCSAAGEARGALEFVGWGIEDEARGWNDFPAERAGDVALVVRGVPPFPPPTEPEGSAPGSWGDGGSLFKKVMNAKRRGYAAVLVAPGRAQRGEPLDAFDPGLPARAGLPVLLISDELAERLGDTRERLRLLAPDQSPADDGPALRSLPVVRLSSDVVRATAPTRNVLGRVRGAGTGGTLLVGAHYDHLGLGDAGSLAPDARGEVHNGADDNASGTAVVLEMARIAAQAGDAVPGDVIFALWSGEELGLLGSEYWVEHPTVPLEELAATLNLDMVGRADDGVVQVLGAGTAAEFEGFLAELGPATGLELVVSLSGDGMGGSDHQSFLRRQIPSLHFFSGVHTDYHKPSDDIERFEADGAARIAQLALDLALAIQGADALEYVEPPAAEGGPAGDRSWSVSFGSVPDYSQSDDGLRLAGTRENSPARNAGLLEGDVLIGFGDVQVDGIHDLVYALGRHKPGDVVLIRYRRDGDQHEVRVTLTSRDPE